MDARGNNQERARFALSYIVLVITKSTITKPEHSSLYHRYWSQVLTFNNLVLNKSLEFVPFVKDYGQLIENLKLPERQNVEKVYWGHEYWEYLHNVSILCKTPQEISQFADMIVNFGELLLCSECVDHYKHGDQPLRLANIIMDTQDPAKAMFDFHNYINTTKRLNKAPRMSWDRFCSLYQHTTT